MGHLPVHPDLAVFHSSLRRTAWLYLAAWSLVFLVGAVALATMPALDLPVVPFAALGVIVTVYNYIWLYRVLFRTRLEISPVGLRFYGVSFDLSASWKQVKLLEAVCILGKRRNRYLQIDRPSVRRTLWFAGTPDFQGTKNRILIGPGTWENDEDLLAKLTRYVPGLDAAA